MSKIQEGRATARRSCQERLNQNTLIPGYPARTTTCRVFCFANKTWPVSLTLNVVKFAEKTKGYISCKIENLHVIIFYFHDSTLCLQPVQLLLVFLFSWPWDKNQKGKKGMTANIPCLFFFSETESMADNKLSDCTIGIQQTPTRPFESRAARGRRYFHCSARNNGGHHISVIDRQL